MTLLKGLSERLPKWYAYAGVILLNTLILFIGINLVCDAVLDYRSYLKKQERKRGAPYSYRKYNPALAEVHPGLSQEEVNSLIAQNGAVTQGYESFTQFKENPYQSRFVNIDPRGFRRIGNQAPWPPPNDQFTVFVFGGSTTYGYGISDEETIPSHLQDLISKTYSRPVNVFNFGRGSYMSIQERVLFEKLLLHGYIPDLAIFIDGLNDLCFYQGEPAYTDTLRALMAEGRVPSPTRCLKELPVMKLINLLAAPNHDKDGFKLPAQRSVSSATMHKQIQEYVQRFKRNKRLAEAAAAEFGVTPIFVWQPVPVYKYDQSCNIFGHFNYDGYVPALKPGYDAMAEVARLGELGDNFIWSADIQEGLHKPLYVDAIHYSSEMARMVAHHILSTIERRDLVAFDRQPHSCTQVRDKTGANSILDSPGVDNQGNAINLKIHAARSTYQDILTCNAVLCPQSW